MTYGNDTYGTIIRSAEEYTKKDVSVKTIYHCICKILPCSWTPVKCLQKAIFQLLFTPNTPYKHDMNWINPNFKID